MNIAFPKLQDPYLRLLHLRMIFLFMNKLHRFIAYCLFNFYDDYKHSQLWLMTQCWEVSKTYIQMMEHSQLLQFCLHINYISFSFKRLHDNFYYICYMCSLKPWFSISFAPLYINKAFFKSLFIF